MKINIELMGSLVDYLPQSDNGQLEITINEKSSISDLLNHLKIKRKVIVAVNEDEEKGLDYILSEGDEVLIFTIMSGG